MRKRRKTFYEGIIKRPFDVICAAAGLIVLSPVLLVLALLVRVRLGSPVLFRQSRPGLDEKIFTLYKFRTMTEERDENGGLKSDEERLTGFGRWLRSTSLDELPELINILKGDMSVVGPRPLLVEYLPRYSREQRRRHEVRPGLTGLAQVRGRNAISWEEKFRLDTAYIRRITLQQDLRILAETVRKVLRREGISAGGETTVSAFVGNQREDKKVKPEAYR